MPRKATSHIISAELRDLAFRASTCLGLLGALWWGLKHPQHPGRCAAPHGSLHTLQRCISTTLSDVLLHWGALLAVGVVIGTTVGVALALMIPKPRARFSRSR